MKFLTAFFGTGVYFYAAPILFQYGYNSYFEIPINFIEPSIRDNIIFFFDLSRIATMVADNLSFWIWVALVIVTLVVWFLLAFQIVRGVLLVMILFGLTGASLFGFYNFGSKIASATTEFRVLPEGCIASGENITHIIPSFYGTTALIVPIYTDSYKLTGSFMARESSSLDCDIQKMTIGPVLK